jgi:hypothetical protein
MSYRTSVLSCVFLSAALTVAASGVVLSPAEPARAEDRTGEVCDGQANAKKPPDTRIKWNVKNMTKRTGGGSDGEPDCRAVNGGGCKDPTPAEATGKVRVRGWDPEKKEGVAADCMAIKAKGGAAGPGPTPPKSND